MATVLTAQCNSQAHGMVTGASMSDTASERQNRAKEQTNKKQKQNVSENVKII